MFSPRCSAPLSRSLISPFVWWTQLSLEVCYLALHNLKKIKPQFPWSRRILKNKFIFLTLDLTINSITLDSPEMLGVWLSWVQPPVWDEVLDCIPSFLPSLPYSFPHFLLLFFARISLRLAIRLKGILSFSQEKLFILKSHYANWCKILSEGPFKKNLRKVFCQNLIPLLVGESLWEPSEDHRGF